MSRAAVELGCAGFGMTAPSDSWSGFAVMLADLLYLHAYGAACAGMLDITLTSVRSENGNGSESDPLSSIKDWIRKHGQNARRAVRTTLTSKVTTCCDAAAALEAQAALQLGAVDERKPCIVVAQNGNGVPFADLLIGVVAVDGDDAESGAKQAFRTTHMMLLRLNSYRDERLTAYEEWLGMHEMGCRERCSIIADCVAKLRDERWPDAMRRLTGSDAHAAAHSTAKELVTQARAFAALSLDTAVTADGSMRDPTGGERAALVIERFIVVDARPPQAAANQHRRLSEVGDISIAGPVNHSFEINTINSAGAFYPTGWEHEIYAVSTRVHEAVLHDDK
jgi:hypothetical protein